MKPYAILLQLFSSLILLSACHPATDEEVKVTTPESLGISSRAIMDFIEAVETERKDDLHSLVIMKNGQVAAKGWWAPYDSTSRHMMFSLSKSFTSTAIGLAQAEGLLSIYDPVISFFPEYVPENSSDNLQNMRIKDLLRMSSGHNQDTWGRVQQNQESWVQEFINLQVEHRPGTHFVYNTGATFMLSAIIQKVSGTTLSEFLTPRLFQPLGIENPTWEKNMNGIDKGGTGLNIRTMDIAHFGQMLLQEGQWKGKQLLPKAWVQQATTLQTANGSNPQSDWNQGYGYQYWRCRPDSVYRGDGAFGQYCIVMPKQNAVIAMTSGTNNMQAILNLVWEHLLLGMKTEPLQEDTNAYHALQDKLASLTLSKVEGNPDSELAATISDKSYVLPANQMEIEKLEFDLKGSQGTVIFHQNGKPSALPVGSTDFAKGSISLSPYGELATASQGAWTDDSTYRVRSYLYESPFNIDYEFHFDEQKITFTREINVSFDANKRISVEGEAL